MKKVYILLFMTLCTLGISAATIDWSDWDNNGDENWSEWTEFATGTYNFHGPFTGYTDISISGLKMYQRTSIVAGKENVKQFQIRGLHIKADSDKTDDFTIDYNSSTKNCRILQQWCGSNFNSNKMYIVDANEYKKTNTYTCNYDEENGKFTFQVFYYYYTSGAYKYGASAKTDYFTLEGHDYSFKVDFGNYSEAETKATQVLNVTMGEDVAYWRYAIASSTANAQNAIESAENITATSANVEISTGGYNYLVIAAYDEGGNRVNEDYYSSSTTYYYQSQSEWVSQGKHKFYDGALGDVFSDIDNETYIVDVEKRASNSTYRIKNPYQSHASKSDRYIYFVKTTGGYQVPSIYVGVESSTRGESKLGTYSGVYGTLENNKIMFEEGGLYLSFTDGTIYKVNKTGAFCLDLNDLTKTVDLSHNWGTIGLDYPVEIPAGVVAYKATVENNVVTLSKFGEAGDVIPANEGAILYAETAGSYNFVAAEGGVEIGDNALKAAIETYNYKADENVYYLGLDGEKVVFKHLAEGGSIAAGKAYLLAPTSAAKLDVVVEGTPTGINEIVPVAVKGNGIYNIQGVRVNDSFKGIVIKDGKKYLKK